MLYHIILSIILHILPICIFSQEAYEYYLEKRPNLSEKGLFNILPKDLKIKIANLKYRKEIISIHAFHYLDIAFVTDLMIHSKPYKVLTGEIVYGINDLPNELSFILSGSVKIKVKGWKNEMTSGFSTTGGYFGDFEFTKSGPRIADYVAVQNCLLLSVPYKVLTNVIKEYPIAGKIFLDELKYRSALFSEQESKSLILNTRPPCKGSNKRHSRRSLIKYVIFICYLFLSSFHPFFFDIFLISLSILLSCMCGLIAMKNIYFIPIFIYSL